MANTTHCQISSATVVEGVPLIQWMNLADTYKPALFVYPSASKTATMADKDTGASILYHPMIIEHKPRLATTNARTSADSAYATTDQVPIVCGGRRGAVKCVGQMADLGASDFANKRMIIGDNGVPTLCATANIETGMRLAADVVDDDVYALYWLSG